LTAFAALMKNRLNFRAEYFRSATPDVFAMNVWNAIPQAAVISGLEDGHTVRVICPRADMQTVFEMADAAGVQYGEVEPPQVWGPPASGMGAPSEDAAFDRRDRDAAFYRNLKRESNVVA